MESLDKNISFLSTSAGLGVVVGVAVGAVFFLCVLSIVVAVAVMTVKKKKGRLDIGDSKDAGNCFNNAIYIDGMPKFSTRGKFFYMLLFSQVILKKTSKML